ncbi:hypothetical protein [uncultured Pontibacter sp.]|uniref:hypothetical protein n=1 Tax=uncultured Pontibacter sp. TaxID=453356 RepID=UPI00260580F8|nr:hypothetical protein [uncultured Pontibacter sp.]
MGWLDSKHRRSEEEAETLQVEEIEKIHNRLSEVYAEVAGKKALKSVLDKRGFDFENIFEFETMYLSDETQYTEYTTDRYRLAKPILVRGYIYKIIYLSDKLVKNIGCIDTQY